MSATLVPRLGVIRRVIDFFVLFQQIDEAVVQRETISNIDRQMERLLKERERLQHDMERLHRKQSKAVAENEVVK